MAEINWIKLSTSLPDNRKIKRIRKLPDGNNVILFWVFLLTRAGESNKSGGVFLTDTLPYSEEDLSADFDFSIEFVHFAILTLEKYSMITRYDDILFIKNWEDYQAIEGMDKIREQNRVRQARFKEKQKQITLGNVTDNVTNNDEVTEGNATDTELELEIDIENTNPDEKQQLGLKENKAYTMDSQVRLGKDRLDEDNTNEKGSKNELEERFNDLWKEYPNKKGKNNAFKAYKKAVEDGVTDEVILDGIRRYNKEIQLKKTEKKYIAYGSTWFNQKRWEDDYITNDYSNKEEKTNNANLASFDDIDWAEIYG